MRSARFSCSRSRLRCALAVVRLVVGTEVEILNWLDDHSRFLLAATTYRRVAGPDVIASFIDTINTHGLPASTLTDIQSVRAALNPFCRPTGRIGAIRHPPVVVA